MKRERCAICDGTRLSLFLDLGETPLANRLVAPAAVMEHEPIYPLQVYLCEDCCLVQLLEVVPPEILFRDYIYVTGTSATMPRHFRELAEMVLHRFIRAEGELVVEVGSNDGTLLRAFQGTRARTLGVEPATNIAKIARERGVDTVNEFFGEATARDLRASHGAAKAIVANNVFAHIAGLRDFTEGVAQLLADDGVYIFEVAYLFDMLDTLSFDAIYHEHLYFHSVTALTALFSRHGLAIMDVERQAVHGGTIRIFVQRANGPHAVTPAVQALLDDEETRGVRKLATYLDFAKRVETLRSELRALLGSAKAEGKRIAGYGSPAKACTLLNYIGLGTETFDFLVDKNPMKQGLLTPGLHIPVRPVEHLVEAAPDFALVLAWNFADEIVEQQAEYVRRGGRFIVPIPSPRVIGE